MEQCFKFNLQFNYFLNTTNNNNNNKIKKYYTQTKEENQP